MDHHLMKVMLDGWSYDDAWSSAPDSYSSRNADAERQAAARRRRRPLLALGRRGSLRPAAGAP